MYPSRSKGQSIAEFIVALAFLVPMLLMIPTLANMLSLQTEAHKASRYVAWERTAYSNADLKSAGVLSTEVQQRFFESSENGFGDTVTSTFESPWRDFKYNTNMVDLTRGVAMSVDQSRSATGASQNASAWLAGKGGRYDPANAVQLDTLQSSRLSIPLKSENSLLEATRSVNVWHHERDTANNPEAPIDPVSEERGFYLASSSALVADGWAPANETMFHDRVNGMNSPARRFQNFWQNNSITRGVRNVFDEFGEHMFTNSEDDALSFDMVDSQQSLNLPTSQPNNLKEYQ